MRLARASGPGGLLAAGLLLLVGVAPVPSASAAPDATHVPSRERGSMTGRWRPTRALQSASSAQPGVINVKFKDGTGFRHRHGRLESSNTDAQSAVQHVLDAFPGTSVQRLFAGASEEHLAATRARNARGAGEPQPDLSLYFRLRLAQGADATGLADRLAALGFVESVFQEPRPAVPPATPSFQGAQGYRAAAAAGGMDADYAQTVTGGRGQAVRIFDIEYSWNQAHEDLSKARATGSAVPNGTVCDPFLASDGIWARQHGTAALGEIVGDANGLGVTGLASSATLRRVNAASEDAGVCYWNVADAVNIAANAAAPGDVILLEQQTWGPNASNPESQDGLVPVEWYPPAWDAIRDATTRGRIVVEAAGNGAENLDAPAYDDVTGANWFSRDSGAIIVGAGNAPGCSAFGAEPARGRLSFSNFGSRLDLQGWGGCVVTSGYGDLQGGVDDATWYTSSFAGTSSASAMVAASAAVLSSIAESRSTTLTPEGIRSILKVTGQAQTFGAAGKVGPLPNLRAAIGATPRTVSGTAGGVTPTAAALTGALTPGSVGTSYRFDYGTTTDYGQQTPATSLAAGASAVAASAQLVDLEPQTTYHFRLVATRSGATVATGVDQSFKTPPAPPVVLTEAATGISQTAARLEGLVNPAGADTAYHFDYGATAGYGSQTPEIGAGAGAFAVTASSQILNLAPSTTYHFRIVATRNGQAAAVGSDRVFVTSSVPPAPRFSPPQSGVAGITLSQGAPEPPPRLSRAGAGARTVSALASRYGARWRKRRNSTVRCRATLNSYGVPIGDDYSCNVVWTHGARRFAGRVHVWVDDDGKVRLTLRVGVRAHRR